MTLCFASLGTDKFETLSPVHMAAIKPLATSIFKRFKFCTEKALIHSNFMVKCFENLGFTKIEEKTMIAEDTRGYGQLIVTNARSSMVARIMSATTGKLPI